MIRNKTMIRERLNVINAFVEANPLFKRGEFKASQCEGSFGTRWEKMHFKGNGNILATLVDWGILKVVREEKGSMRIGGYTSKEILSGPNGAVYNHIDDVPRGTYVMKIVKEIPNTIETKTNVYIYNGISDFCEATYVKRMGEQIYYSRYDY